MEALEKQVYVETLRRAAHNFDEMLEELSTLRLLNDFIQHEPDFNSICCNLVHFITETMNVEKASVMVLDEEKQELKLRVAKSFYQDEPAVYFEKPWSGKAFKLGEGIAGYVAKHRKSVLINDTRRDPRFIRFRGQKVNVRSILSLPLAHGDRVYGVLNLSNSEPNAFDGRKEHALTLISYAASIALSHARLTEELRRMNETLSARDRELDAVVKLSESLRSNHRLDSALAASLRSILTAFNADIGAVFLKNENTGHMELKTYGARAKTKNVEFFLNSLNELLGHRMALSRRPVSFPVRFPVLADTIKSQPSRGICIGVPLLSGRHFLGFFLLFRPSDRPLEAVKRKLLVSLCDQIANVIHNSNLVSRLHREI